MIVLEVNVNGRPVCVAGAKDLSILNADIMAHGKLGPKSYGTRHARETLYAELRVGGMTSRSFDPDDSKDRHLDWADLKLAVGDEVRVRLVDAATADRPKRSRPTRDREPTEAMQKQQFEWAKACYFANRSKYEKRSKHRPSN